MRKELLLSLALGLGGIASLLMGSVSANSQTVKVGVGLPVPPPLSRAQAKYYLAHPAEWDRLLDRLPTMKEFPLRKRQAQLVPPAPNTWTPITNPPPSSGLSNPLLLTDGTVIVHALCSANWYKLTPDAFGSYINGTWSAIGSLPAPYAPLYFASQILSDGRVVINGGEYDNGCKAVWGNNGAIYTPSTNSWATLPPPGGWTTIGDAQSVILANGKYMLADCCTTKQAILNSTTLAWTPTGSGKFDINDEEGWALLHDNSVLTSDAYVGVGSCGLGAERYKPLTGAWTSAGNATTQLSDCLIGGNRSFEVGPLVVRPTGTVVAFSGVTTGVAGTSIYHPATSTWSIGPNLPTIAGGNYNLADAPAVALPSGNILFAASPGLFSTPAHFFQFNTNSTITQQADTPNALSISGYYVNFLMLPTGQVLETDFSNDVEIYMPTGTYKPTWQPVITSVPTTLIRGNTFQVAGTRLSGITHGVYGDDQQAATNFPLVRLTNNTSNQVYFAETRGFSSRSDKPAQSSTANFTVPLAAPVGAYTLNVVANGIQSAPVAVTVN